MEEQKTHIDIKWVLSTIPNKLILVIIILSITSSFEGVINGYVLGQMTKIVFNNFENVGHFLLMVAMAYLITYTSAYLFLLTTQKALQFLTQRLKYEFFISDFFQTNHENLDSSDVINKVTNVSNQIQRQYFQPLFYIFQSLATIVTTTFVILETNVFLGIIYILISASSFLPSIIGKKQMNMKTDTWSVANTKLVTIIKDIFQGKNEIKKFGVINGFTKKFSHSLNTEEENFFKLNRTQYTVQFIAWICAVISDVIPMGIGLIMVVNHIAGVEISTIVTLSLSADAVVGSVREFANYQTQITSTSSIRTFMTYNIKKIGSNSFKEKTKNISLYLKNIAFYRQKKLVFKDINLELNDDQKVIITGDSGVGKSTLLQIIAGQLMPSKGGILFNGHKIAIEDSVLISQKPWLFEGTVKENLTLYQDFPESALVQTLKDVRLWDELGTDPLNYKIESTGINVSGGQAQRLAIARGLLRNKQLFLLDEITASLDKENAYKIRKLIYELPVMVIEVAHNIDNELVKNYSIRINVLTKNGLKNE